MRATRLAHVIRIGRTESVGAICVIQSICVIQY
jgi:hypothetical protein